MTDTTLRSRFVLAGRTRTHYTEAGDNGPALVLCHGGGPGSSGEAGFGRLLGLLASTFAVYAPDGVGGFGQTDPYWPATEGAQSRVDQLEAFLDTVCLDQVYLSGNSMGAWVAAKYTLEHPDRVRKLVLIASNTIAAAMGIPVPQTDAMRTFQSYDGTEPSMRRVMEALVFDKSVITDQLIATRNRAANRPGGREARATYDQGQARLTKDPNLRLKFEMKHTLPRLTVPTLFAWGEEDAFAPVSVGKQLQEMLPNVPFHYVPRAGHQVQTDQPEALAKLMTDFFTAEG